MVSRSEYKRILSQRLGEYAAVALIGSRQAGKTTLARTLKGAYYDLELEPDRLRLDLDWPSLMDSRQPVILDEAQSWGEIFPRIRGAIDAHPSKKGRFLLLGSVSPSLMTQVSESLAGRLSLVELTPFLTTELRDVSLEKVWRFGGYPEGGVLNAERFPRWQRDYLSLLTQRDLPNWGMPARPQVVQRLAQMIASVHGQVWNASQIGQSLGISYHTVNTYVDYLEGAFLVRRLLPYQANLRKRLVKRPKVYWRDSGLLHALLNVTASENILAKPWVGASWEAFVIEQILGAFQQSDIQVAPYYFRTSDGYDIDLVLDFGSELWAVEIKLTTSPGPNDFNRLEAAADMIGAERRILVSQVQRSQIAGDRISCNLPWLLRDIR